MASQTGQLSPDGGMLTTHSSTPPPRLVVKTPYDMLIVGLLSNACWKAEKGQ